MKKIEKLLIVVFFLLLSFQSFAQTLGINAGLNLANMVAKDNEETYSEDYKLNPGFHFGMTSEFPFTDMLSLETGLLLSTKGMKISEEEEIMGITFKIDTKTNLYYLDIPITLKASTDIGSVKIYGAIGPYLGMGLSGKVKAKVETDGQEEEGEESIEWGNDEEKSDLKRLDYGLLIGAGVQINVIQIGISYGLGLANISPYTEGGYKINNRLLGISVAYIFGGKTQQ